MKRKRKEKKEIQCNIYERINKKNISIWKEMNGVVLMKQRRKDNEINAAIHI